MYAPSTFDHGYSTAPESASTSASDVMERRRLLSQPRSTTASDLRRARGTSPSPSPSRPGSTAIPQSLVPGGKVSGRALKAKPSELFFQKPDERHFAAPPYRHSTGNGPPMIHSYTYPVAYSPQQQGSSSAPLAEMPIPITQTPSQYPPAVPYFGTSSMDTLPCRPHTPAQGPLGPRAFRPQSMPQPAVSMPEPQAAPMPQREEENYEDDDLALALVLSAQSVNERSRQAAEEEEELSRALAESARLEEERKEHSVATDIGPDDWGESESSSSHHRLGQKSCAAGSASPPDPEQQMREDEALARRLQMEAEEEVRAARRNSLSQHIFHVDDEAFARQLVAEEEAQAALKDQEGCPAPEPDASSEVHDLPAYSQAPPSVPRASRPTLALFHDAHLGRSQSAGVISTARADLPSLYPTAIRSMSMGPPMSHLPAVPNTAPVAPSVSSSPETSPTHPIPDPMASAPRPGMNGNSSRLSYASTASHLASVEEEALTHKSKSESALVPLLLHLVEPEFLIGVSMGFSAPSITPELVPMQEPVQNVITLPYGKAPPYHIQAPSWRHLLKLMVRMRTARIEPSIEAMALKQSELKLRAVVQFVRVHHRSSEWRTILYLTLDYPVPNTQGGGWKYVNGDVNTLPYSYSLSSLPALLRDGADSPMCKSYTIPLTPNTPYPTMPISMPNMALYLQSALEESRKAIHDSSSGVRKLAQLVDNCYPEDVPVYEPSDMPERKGVRYRLRKVFGKKEGRERGGNEDVYELITPFMPDEEG